MAEKKKESKREKFVRIAEARTNKILNMVDLLGNCSNPSIYEYSQSDVNQIFSAIEKCHKKMRKRSSVRRIRKRLTKFST